MSKTNNQLEWQKSETYNYIYITMPLQKDFVR